MADVETAPAIGPEPAAPPRPHSEIRETIWFLVKLAIAVLLFRSFLFAPFSIPSESMQPRLLVGDYLFVSKWDYGYSRHSLPLSVPLIPGRVFAHVPERGDVVVFKAPPGDRDDYIKRVIGRPGDLVQMRAGQLILNGVAIPKQRIADFVVPAGEGRGCPPQAQDTLPDGAMVCRYRRYRETLPGGRSYEVLDQGDMPADNTRIFSVPAGHVFLMGDNRDDSMDSRFVAVPGGGIGLVPIVNLEGKAVVTFWSAGAQMRWWNPLSWVRAARWDRIGEGF